MTSKSFCIYGASEANSINNGLHLRTINVSDLSNLREWKNSNKIRFFYQFDISSAEQLAWFQRYSNCEDDFMFIVVNKSMISVGCIGLRLHLDGSYEIYNVILGDTRFGGKGLMAYAMGLVLRFCFQLNASSVWLYVLLGNPAIRWYLKRGFIQLETFDKSLKMLYDISDSGGYHNDFSIWFSGWQ